MILYSKTHTNTKTINKIRMFMSVVNHSFIQHQQTATKNTIQSLQAINKTIQPTEEMAKQKRHHYHIPLSC